MTLYGILLVAHSYLRWGVVALVLLMLARTFSGWMRPRPWNSADERTHIVFVAVVDTQLLLGLWLYLQASPIVRAFLADPKAGMKITALRFFGMEHALTMSVALVVVHVARARSKKRTTDRHKKAAIASTFAFALMLVGIPWPFLRHGRPLLRELPHATDSNSACLRATSRAAWRVTAIAVRATESRRHHSSRVHGTSAIRNGGPIIETRRSPP